MSITVDTIQLKFKFGMPIMVSNSKHCSKKNRIIIVKWNDRLLMYDRKKKTTTY